MEQFALWGTVVNALAIFLASLSVILFNSIIKFISNKKKKSNNRENIFIKRGRTLSDVLLKGLALCIGVIGIDGALKTQNMLIMIISLVIGTTVGTLIDIDHYVKALGDFLEKKSKGKFDNIAEGFVNASLICCVGAMAVIGSLESGLSHNHNTLYTKSLIDFFTVIVLTATMGGGVILSSVSVLAFQGTITVFARFLAPVLSSAVITEISAVGSLLIIGLSLNLLDLAKFKTMNYLPSVFIPILLYAFI